MGVQDSQFTEQPTPSRVPGFMMWYPMIRFREMNGWGPWVKGYPSRQWIGLGEWWRETRRQ